MSASRKSDRWTPGDLAKLEALAAEKLPWRDIADRIGRTESSCLTAIAKIRKQRRREAGLPEVEVVRQPWTKREVAELLRLREDECLRWVEIDRLLNRPTSSARTKYQALRRQRRKEARATAPLLPLQHVTLTASIFGDPAPGRSALDKRLAGIVEVLPPSNHREVYYASRPKITLAGETSR